MNTSMTKKRSIIRMYDRVKIINPEFFIRCGYPKCQEDEMKVVIKEFGYQIHRMIEPGPGAAANGLAWHGDERLFEKVCREIAYARLKNMGFGGGKRTIHTERREEFMGKTFSVTKVKICKTGSYYPPSYG